MFSGMIVVIVMVLFVMRELRRKEEISIAKIRFS